MRAVERHLILAAVFAGIAVVCFAVATVSAIREVRAGAAAIMPAGDPVLTLPIPSPTKGDCP